MEYDRSDGLQPRGPLQPVLAPPGERGPAAPRVAGKVEMTSAAQGRDAGGLRGDSGLPLVDLLQVWSLNRFSGLIAVASHGREGKLHFADGDIVHAEAEGVEGEPAVQSILTWAEATFEPFPNTTTLSRTIRKKVSHLLLDAHRLLDEQRRSSPGVPAPAAKPSAAAGSSVLDQIRAIRGVIRLVRFGADGRPLGPADAEADALAAKGLYLALTHGDAVRQAFGLRELSLAALEGGGESFLVIRAGTQYLGVAVAQGTPLDPVLSQVRALLTRPAPR